MSTGSTNSRPNHHSKRGLPPACPPATKVGPPAASERSPLSETKKPLSEPSDSPVIRYTRVWSFGAIATPIRPSVDDSRARSRARRGRVRRQRAGDVRVADPLPRHVRGRARQRVVGDVEARADPAVRPQVRGAVVVPLRRVDAVRVDRVDRDVDDAGVRRRVQVGARIGAQCSPPSMCGRGRGCRRSSRSCRWPRRGRARVAGSTAIRPIMPAFRGRRSSRWRRRRSTCRRRRRRT